MMIDQCVRHVDNDGIFAVYLQKTQSYLHQIDQYEERQYKKHGSEAVCPQVESPMDPDAREHCKECQKKKQAAQSPRAGRTELSNVCDQPASGSINTQKQ